MDWNVLLNGILVGSWSWSDTSGTGTENLNLSFAPIAGAGTYTIAMDVTNEVPFAGGSIGINNGSATLGTTPEPGTLLLLSAGLVGLAALVRRKLEV